MVAEANLQLQRQSSQNPQQSLNDTTGSHTDQNVSNATTKPLDLVYQITLAIEHLANKNSQPSLFHHKNTLTFLTTTKITDLWTQFNPHVTHEFAAVLRIELKHATRKPAQTIGLLGRTHASVTTHIKAATGEYRNNLHIFLPSAVLNHNTTYHASLSCEPSRVFPGRIPHDILGNKLGYNSKP